MGTKWSAACAYREPSPWTKIKKEFPHTTEYSLGTGRTAVVLIRKNVWQKDPVSKHYFRNMVKITVKVFLPAGTVLERWPDWALVSRAVVSEPVPSMGWKEGDELVCDPEPCRGRHHCDVLYVQSLSPLGPYSPLTGTKVDLGNVTTVQT
jgi:hypothetical protein